MLLLVIGHFQSIFRPIHQSSTLSCKKSHGGNPKRGNGHIHMTALEAFPGMNPEPGTRRDAALNRNLINRKRAKVVKSGKAGCIAHDLGWGRILGLINNVQNAELTGLGGRAPDWKHEAAIKCSIVHSAWDTACSNLTHHTFRGEPGCSAQILTCSHPLTPLDSMPQGRSPIGY
jgi:hypothetical protein